MLVNESAHAHTLVVELRFRRIHVPVGVEDGLRLVVIRQATIITKAHRHRFVAAVHGHEVDIDVDDEVALARAPVDADFLPVARLAETHETVGLFGVVAVVTIGIERVCDFTTHHPAHLGFGHLPMEGVGNDDVDVVDAVVGQKLEHYFERGLTGIGGHHRWLGDYGGAVKWLRKAVSADPGDNYNPAELGEIFMDLGDLDRAEYWVRRSIELGPESYIANHSMQFLHLHRGDEVAALEYGRKANEIGSAWDTLFSFQLIADHELRAGRYSEARAVYEENRPELLGEDAPNVEYRNARVAIDLASVLSRTGEQERADLLLKRSFERIRTRPRSIGMRYPISDVEIYALQGENKKALSALRQAIDEGWRGLWWYSLRLDPGLESLHEEPEYQAIVAEIEADMAVQLARVREMERNGELEPIPELAAE